MAITNRKKILILTGQQWFEVRDLKFEVHIQLFTYS